MIGNNSNNNTVGVASGGSKVSGIVFGILAAAFLGPFLFVLITSPELSAMEGKSPIPVIVILMLGFIGLLNSVSVLNSDSALLRDKETRFDLKVSLGCWLLIAITGLIVAGTYVGKTLPTLIT